MTSLLAAIELDRAERPGLELLGGVVLAALFIFTRPLRRRLVHSERAADSLFGGMAAAYVFLVLLAELDELHVELGDRGYILVLGSFVAIYGLEHAAHVIPRLQGKHGEELVLLWLRAAMLWCYGFLFLLTIPDVVEKELGLYLLTLAVGALAVAFKSYEVSEHHPRVYQRWARWVVATGPLAGAGIDLLAVEPSPVLLDLLITFVAGFIMLLAFTGSALDHTRTQYTYFIGGVGIYVVVFVTRMMVLD
jgi:hypothetical protein